MQQETVERSMFTRGDDKLDQHHSHMDDSDDGVSDHEEAPGGSTITGGSDQAPQPLTSEAADAVVKQIEFYFSDASLPSDKKLLKQIRKDPEGFVPIKVFANFRKVRALTRDVESISNALKASKVLLLSDDGKQVRRVVPVPEYNVEEIQRRTVVVENLPVGSTIESVTKLMRAYGTVKLVRICSKETKGKLPTWLTTALGSAALHTTNSTGGRSTPSSAGGGPDVPVKPPHAYVEYADEEDAVMAVAALHDSEGWRPHGIQVHHLIFASSSTPKMCKPLPRSGTLNSHASGGGAPLARRPSRDASPAGNSRLMPAMSERVPSASNGGASWRSTNSSWAGANPGGSGGGAIPGALARRSSHVDSYSSPNTPCRGVTSSSRFVSSSNGGAAPDVCSGGADLVSNNSKRYVPPGRRSIEPGSVLLGGSGAPSPAIPSSPMYAAAPAGTVSRPGTSVTGAMGSPARPTALPRSSPGSAPGIRPQAPSPPPNSDFASMGCAMPIVPDSGTLRPARYVAPISAPSATDLVINPSQLALRPIRTNTSRLDSSSGGSTPGDCSSNHPAVAIAALLASPANTPANTTAGSRPALGSAAPSGQATPAASTAVAAALGSLSGRATPTAAGVQTRSSFERRTSSNAAPKFVLDLPPGTNNPGTGSNNLRGPSTPGASSSGVSVVARSAAGTARPVSSSTGASPLAQPPGAASKAFWEASMTTTTITTTTTTGVTFQPLSPTCMPPGSFAHMPFHHSGQYIAEVEEFINRIIPVVPNGPAGAAPTFPADTAPVNPTVTPQLAPQLSTVSEGGESNSAQSFNAGAASLHNHTSSAASSIKPAPSVVVAATAAASAALTGAKLAAASRAPDASTDSAPDTLSQGDALSNAEQDEEVARFRAALEEARGVNPASAQAQAHASRALAAAAAGGSVRPAAARPPRPVATGHGALATHASVGASGADAVREGKPLARHSSWHSTSSHDGQASVTDPGAASTGPSWRLPSDMPSIQLSAAGDTLTSSASVQRKVVFSPGQADARHGPDDDESEGEDDAGAGAAGQPARRRRRRGSRAGSRSRRASTTSVGGSELTAVTAGELHLPSSGHDAASTAATAHLRSQASRLVASAGGSRTLSPQLKHAESNGAAGASRPHSKADYAAWAAATPEYRAEASAKYGGAAGADGHGLGASPIRSTGVDGHHLHVVVAAGPDGTRGFHAGTRSRPVVAAQP